MSKAEYRPASGKVHALITQGGKILCVFKKAPTDEQGHAMAAALSGASKERHSPQSMDMARELLRKSD